MKRPSLSVVSSSSDSSWRKAENCDAEKRTVASWIAFFNLKVCFEAQLAIPSRLQVLILVDELPGFPWVGCRIIMPKGKLKAIVETETLTFTLTTTGEIRGVSMICLALWST